MTANTLTTIAKLAPGDIFQLPDVDLKFILIPGEPIRTSKHLWEFFGRPLKGSPVPRKFRKETEVVFIKKSKSIVI